ncbi:hypothetical protein BH11PAT2_BH11PAT2_04820 [soil metagenome]
MNEIDTSKIKYVAYARKSTDDSDKQINSIPDQLKEIDRIGRGLVRADTLTDERSAKVLGRPGFEQMKNLIESGKAQGIICWKINRLARNPVDGGWIIWKLQQGAIRHLKTDDGDYYPGSDMLLLYLHFGMANQFSLNLSKDVTRGMLSKAESGRRPGSAPLGYLNSNNGNKGEEFIYIDPVRGPIIQKMMECMLAGTHNAPQILEIATEEWGLRTRPTKDHPRGCKLTKSAWYKILQNPFFYGKFQYPIGHKDAEGKRQKIWVDGTHDALITYEQFRKIQKILKQHAPKRTNQTFAYIGLMRCGGCGARITAERKNKTQKNGNKHQYVYYRCTGQVDRECKQQSIREDRLEEAMQEFLSSMEISPEFHAWAIAEFKKDYQKEKSDKNVIGGNQQTRHDEIKSMLRTLLDSHLLGRIDGDDFSEKKHTLEQELVGLKPYMPGSDTEPPDWTEDADNLLTFAEKAAKEFKEGEFEKRRAIIAALGTEHVLDQGVLTFQVEKPIEVLIKYPRVPGNDFGILEPLNSEEEYTQIASFEAKSERMWTP